MLARHHQLIFFIIGLLLALLALAIALEPDRAHTTAPPGSAERIVFMSNRAGGAFAIWAMDTDGTNAVQLSHPGPAEADYSPRISPDGRKIVFGRHVSPGSNYEILVMDSDGSSPQNLTNNPAADVNPSWSPDGTKIAFESDRDNFFRDIYVMNADGSDVTRMTDDEAYDGRPVFSPDGTKIAWESQREYGYSNIFTMPAGGGAATNVTPWAWDVMQPAWAPDGSAIAVSGEGLGFDDPDSIWVIPLGGGNPAQLNTESGMFPRYAPDGGHIVYASEEGGVRQVHIVGSGGGSATDVSNNGFWEDMPDWGYLATGKLGDLSGDGDIDVGDVMDFLRYLAGAGAAPPGLANGDLDCDGDYDHWDVLGLLWYLAGVTDDPVVCLE